MMELTAAEAPSAEGVKPNQRARPYRPCPVLQAWRAGEVEGVVGLTSGTCREEQGRSRSRAGEERERGEQGW